MSATDALVAAWNLTDPMWHRSEIILCWTSSFSSFMYSIQLWSISDLWSLTIYVQLMLVLFISVTLLTYMFGKDIYTFVGIWWVLLSVLWCCWLGGRKGMPVKI